MFCTKCGNDAGEANYCPVCGAQIGPAQTMNEWATTSNNTFSSSMAENVAGLLTYVLGWITGIVFLFIDKRPFVRFHAMQSIIVFGALTIINIIIRTFFSHLPFGISLMFSLLNTLISIAGFVLWILLIVKAYQGKLYKLPYVGDLAEQFLKNNNV